MVAGVNSFEDALISGLLSSIYPVLTASWEMKREPQTSLLCGRWPRLWFTVQIWELARAVLILHEAVRGPQA